MHCDIHAAMELHAASLRARAAAMREEAATRSLALENEADHYDSIRCDAECEPDDSPVVRLASLALAPLVESVAAKRIAKEASDAILAAVAAEAPIRDALATGDMEFLKANPDAVAELASRDEKFARQAREAGVLA